MSRGGTLDVAVVGAGPAGARTALLLAEAGLTVAILEEHDVVGRPVQCAGLLSERVSQELGGEVAVLNTVSGARIHSPSGHVLAFDAGRPRAMVVDRAAFDQSLAGQAVEAGADLLLERRVMEVRASPSGCSLMVRDRSVAGSAVEELVCRAIVGADGPPSIVRRSMGLPRPRHKLVGYQVSFSCRQPMGKDHVDLFGGRDVAPGFFAWVVPQDEHSGLVGLASEPGGMHPKARLEAFMASETLRELLPDLQVTGNFAGAIPLGPVHRPVADRVVLVGDAAAQAKATSGGGVYPALVAARHAAAALVRAHEEGDLSARNLMSYPKAFDAEVGAELAKAARLRRSFRAMSDRMVDDLIVALDDPELLDTIVQEGDIEFPSRLVRSLLRRSPRLVRLAGPLLRGFF
ncbi:MAG: geranylgeranyl reductase family protein [Thermoplasmata archaeon]|nr:NAD(P)/FAD-dependent oxidoreductase [Thermoplasmata archaeon]NIS11154.1 NAD(P)/FAD-dependent oxidoreductase [Thermoplasmata archaeon]NIS19093.1 NAD(P)/FAD-dependent oxidoreductase [Thermoplasmata archaeon]NIT76152.1 NAD(P)/FAD-dependent oxidoreductase [Thermoplasmata archaeon]NIU48237.1 NAD(P)/FAD-dependent oxidoreductase [Thermoplasmata archaeon]